MATDSPDAGTSRERFVRRLSREQRERHVRAEKADKPALDRFVRRMPREQRARADRQILRVPPSAPDKGGRLTALDTFSTGRVEGPAGKHAITDDGELVTTNPNDPERTFWGATIHHQETIPGGVEPGEPVHVTVSNAAGNLPNVRFPELPSGDDVQGGLLSAGVVIGLLVAAALALSSFAKGAGRGITGD